MTRKEAYDYYEYLKKSGRFEDFRKKTKSQLSGKDLELFFYDDGEVLYNPFSGTMSKVSGNPEVVRYTKEQLEALGLVSGKKTKSYQEMTPEEQILFSNLLEDD